MGHKLKTWGWSLLSLGLTLLAPNLASATITNYSVASDASTVTYRYTYSGAPNFRRVYLDTDRNPATGYSLRGIGADFMIENGNVFRYSGSSQGWGFTPFAASNERVTAPTVSWTIARSLIGSPSVISSYGNTSNNDFSSVVVQNLSTTTTVPLPPPTTTTLAPAATWTRCATEGGTCSFTGTRQVRYGANGVFAYQTATGSISCTNGIFGDPVVGTQKFCDYSSSQTSTPVTTTLPPPPPPPSGSTTQVSYSVSAAQIANPERGFYHDINCVGGTMDVNQLRSYRVNEGITLIHCYNQIGAFVNAPLSSSILSLFDSNLSVMRNAGVKTVIRFVYSMRDDGADATLSLINTHMDQLAPYFAKNKDVIATVQIGFVGSWGEWANSQHFGQIQSVTAQNNADRKALTEKLLSVVPSDRTVQIRFPYQKMAFYGSTPLSATEAFTGTPRARIGHHNDCFLANSNDVGTYTNYSTQFPYIMEETKYLPIGGETCAVGGTPRTDCGTAQNEMANAHWSYLNLDFNKTVLDRWRSEGCFPAISAKLGYRFVLQNGTFSTSARVGGSMNVTLNIQNQGYASPYNARGLELILRNASTGAVYRANLNADPRRWLPGTHTVQQTLTLPSNIPAGTYALLLNMPDPAASLYGNPAYSIQLANSNVWEATTGFNRLNANIVVSP